MNRITAVDNALKAAITQLQADMIAAIADLVLQMQKYMPIAGGTFTGDVDMGSHVLTVPTPPL
jgi:hypothetical protein